MGAPNWSWAAAVNCWLAPAAIVAGEGVTKIFVSVWLTVTTTLLVTLRPLALVIVAVRV